MKTFWDIKCVKELVKSYEDFCESSRKVLEECVCKTESDIGRKLTLQEHDLCVSLGAATLLFGLLDAFFKKGEE